MTDIALTLIALPLLLGAYSYVIYPLILWMLSGKGEPVLVVEPAEWPLVSIVIPAYNEQAQIGGAIDALLEQDYPADRRQILVLSDASSDRTDEIVAQYSDRGVELLRMSQRSGKTAAENASREHLRGSIVVNSDASIRLLPGTVRRLVMHMQDPTVGVASGRDVSVAPGQSAANAAEAGYVGYEMWIRSLETRLGGIVGASGSGYAIRRELHMLPVRDDLSRDFSAALVARTHGFSSVSVNDALCLVPRTSSLRNEYRRKVRTISRGMATLIHQRHLLNPARYGLFAWKLLSHKLGRWLLPVTAIPAFLGLILLAPAMVWAAVLLALTVTGLLMAVMGAMWPPERHMPKIVSAVAFGVSANLAVVHAWTRNGRRPHDHIWEPTRRSPADVPEN